MNINSQGNNGTQTRKKRGPPFGNQNARVHGYYSKKLTPAELEEFRKETLSDETSPEITLMKIKVRSILANDPGNKKLLERTMLMLAAAVRTFYGIGGKDGEGWKEALQKIFIEIFQSLGMGRGGKIASLRSQ